MKYLPLLLSNLLRKKTRTILTLLSVMVAFLLYCFLYAIAHAFSGPIELLGQDRLIVRNRVSLIQPLPLSYKTRIASTAGVTRSALSCWFGGTYQGPKNFFPQLVVEPEDYLALYPEFLLAPEALRQWLAVRTGAVAGRKLAQRFGWKIGDRIPLQATIFTQKNGSDTWTFDLVGIYDGTRQDTDTSQFLFRWDYFDEARAIGNGLVGTYTVRVRNPDQAAAVARSIDAEFGNSAYETTTETEKAFVSAFVRQIGNIGLIMTGIMGAVFFTILLVTGNTMAQAIRERTAEIGVLKALGFSNTRVLVLVLAESVLLSGLGGLAGLGLGWALIRQGDPTHGMLPSFALPADRLVLGVGLVLALGLVTGLAPALWATRLRIADALRRS